MDQKDMVKPLPVKITIQAGSEPENPSSKKIVPVDAAMPDSPKPDQNNLWNDLTRFSGDDLVKGFVFSLILDKPRCKQRGRR